MGTDPEPGASEEEEEEEGEEAEMVRIVAVDLQEMAPIEGVKQLQVNSDSSTSLGGDVMILHVALLPHAVPLSQMRPPPLQDLGVN